MSFCKRLLQRPSFAAVVLALSLMLGFSGVCDPRLWAAPQSGSTGPQQGSFTVVAGSAGPTTTWVRTGGLLSSVGGSMVPVGPSNGDFASGLMDWSVAEAGGVASPGSVMAVTDQAQLLEGDSFLVTLSQTFLMPAFATTLTFELELNPGFDTSAMFLPDAFEMSLLDSNSFPLLGTWASGATSSFNLQESGAANLAPEVTWNGTTVTVDVAAVAAGEVVTLYFDLVNGDTDVASGIRVDNVVLNVDPPPLAFVRGDVDGDRVADAADEVALLDLLSGFGAIPSDCQGADFLEAADVNDNEFVTIADYLQLRRANLGLTSIPAPDLYCDFDPSDDTRGFDMVDSNYLLTAGDVVLDPPMGSTDRDVLIPILLDTPTDVTAFTVNIDYDDSVLTPFDPALGEGLPFDTTLGNVFVQSTPGTLLITVWALNDGDTLLTASQGNLQSLGTLRFHLADFAILPGLDWIEEAFFGFGQRMTIVDEVFEDHHPAAAGGVGEFVRGNSNDDDNVDLSDPVFTLAYLFTMGPAPVCLDAADANNDSSINITDAVYTLNYLFAMGQVFPAPFPGCGFDVGPIDLLDCSSSFVCQP